MTITKEMLEEFLRANPEVAVIPGKSGIFGRICRGGDILKWSNSGFSFKFAPPKAQKVYFVELLNKYGLTVSETSPRQGIVTMNNGKMEFIEERLDVVQSNNGRHLTEYLKEGNHHSWECETTMGCSMLFGHVGKCKHYKSH